MVFGAGKKMKQKKKKKKRKVSSPIITMFRKRWCRTFIIQQGLEHNPRILVLGTQSIILHCIYQHKLISNCSSPNHSNTRKWHNDIVTLHQQYFMSETISIQISSLCLCVCELMHAYKLKRVICVPWELFRDVTSMLIFLYNDMSLSKHLLLWDNKMKCNSNIITLWNVL